MNSWAPQTVFCPLWEEILKCRPSASQLIASVLQRLRVVDQSVSEELSLPSCVEFRDAYLIRFVLPVAELANAEAYCTDDMVDALCVHLLWCLYWRSLDTLLDDPRRPTESVEDLAHVLVTAVRCDTQLRAKLRLTVALKTELVVQPCSVYRSEKKGSTLIDDIWRRASPFLIVPETIFQFPAERMDAYKAYLNVFGLAHDCQDLFTDIQQGLESVPVRWLRDIDADLQLHPRTLRAYYGRAADTIAILVRETKERLPEGTRQLFDALLMPIEAICAEFQNASNVAPDDTPHPHLVHVNTRGEDST